MSDGPGFGVDPEALRAAARALRADAEQVQGTVRPAVEACGLASGAVGEGPLAAALGRFTEVLDAAGRAIAEQVGGVAVGLDDSATTYVTRDTTTARPLAEAMVPARGPGLPEVGAAPPGAPLAVPPPQPASGPGPTPGPVR